MTRSKIWCKAGMLLLAVLIPMAIRAQDTSEIVVIRGEKKSVEPGEQVQFSAQKLDGAVYAPGLAFWRSLNEDILAIDQNGKVKGLKPGSATIMATVGKSTSTLDLTVVAAAVPAVTSPSPAQPSVVQGLVIQGKRTLAIEEQASLSATVNGSPAANVSWLSADPTVVTVDASGKAKGLKTGEAIIIASAGEHSDFITIEVTGQQAQAAAVPATNLFDASDPESPSTPTPAPIAAARPAVTPEVAPAATPRAPEQKPVLQWPPMESAVQPTPARTNPADEVMRTITPDEQVNQPQRQQEQRMQALQALLGVLGSAAQQKGGSQPSQMNLPNQAQQSQNPGVNTYANMFNYFLSQQRGGTQQQETPNLQGNQTGQIGQQLTSLLGMYQNLQNNTAGRASPAAPGQPMPNQTNQVAQQLMSLLGNYQGTQQNPTGQSAQRAAPGQEQNAQFLQAFLSLMSNIQQVQDTSRNQTQPGFQQPNYINPPPPPQQGGQQQLAQSSLPNSEQIASLLGVLAASMPAPKSLVNARTAYISYQQNYERVISDFPKKLREWGRWTIVDNPDQADILLHLSQGRLNAFSNEIVVQVYDRAQQNIASVSCERRLSGTGGVLVNRLKKEIEKQENPNKK